MSTKMLIDARHSEETRVTIVKGNRVEEFDYESAAKVQLKGNIYLAKVTRVEPSLQAAFVDFGGNRHGFLPFSEIHPDYYQLSDDDMAELVDEEQAYIARQEAYYAQKDEAPSSAETDEGDGDDHHDDEHDDDVAEELTPESQSETIAEALADDIVTISLDDEDENDEDHDEEVEKGASDDDTDEADDADDDLDDDDEDEDFDDLDDDNEDDSDDQDSNRRHHRRGRHNNRRGRGGRPQRGQRQPRQHMDAEEIANAARMRRLRTMKRRYKIQDVIKRNQIMLIQVVKEERGNKGAALTTYMSIAGRYSVLMPNTTHSGGISRKISNVRDRRQLKSIMAALKVPNGMGCIIRTAGLKRTKAEIKRDFDYLLRIWNSIREYTLKSVAPAIIYEEGNLIKRTIRDLYDRNIDELLVEGERGFHIARDFMKLLVPSHANRVKHYQDRIPLFHRYQVENQLESMFNPVVTLKSGGYLVINPTEALIAIDVNSGKATREHNIEETALATNLEAAEEIGRQLKLRDMAGLVVIDFIDMEDRGNIRQIERKMADALKHDRARVQVGRISQLGLMEMSRQRLRPNLLEASTKACPHCEGTGRVRSVESSAIYLIRAIEEEGVRSRSSLLSIRIPTNICIYLLNNKRRHLTELENRFGLRIELMPDDSVVMPNFEIDRVALEKNQLPQSEAITQETIAPMDIEIVDDTPEESVADEIETNVSDDAESSHDEQQPKERRRRRRGRRGGRRRREHEQQEGDEYSQDSSVDNNNAEDKATEVSADNIASPSSEETGEEKPKPRRTRRKKADETEETSAEATSDETSKDGDKEEKPKTRRGRRKKVDSEESNADTDAKANEDKPKRRGRPRKSAAQKAEDTADNVAKAEPKPEAQPVPETKTAPKEAPAPAPAVAEEKPVEAPTADNTSAEDDNKPKRKGWWQRALGK